MQLAIIPFVKAGGFLNVFVYRIVRKRYAVMLLDPAHFFGRRILQVHPNGFEQGQLFERLDFFLKQPAIGQGKNIEHGWYPLRVVVAQLARHTICLQRGLILPMA